MIPFKYPCFLLQPRKGEKASPTFCMFYAPVGEILRWSAIERIEARKGAVQRAMNPGRVRGVKRLFSEDKRNTIPTSVIVTLKVGAVGLRVVQTSGSDKIELHVLAFEIPDDVADKDKPGLVVDGQHRLLGMRDFSLIESRHLWAGGIASQTRGRYARCGDA